ncbi:MAG TPA: hypothetical protein VLA76_03010 [Candidatus Angelobacter sp.]|nr:hypothetical protein [Candidatus Angelobacter sp.]
MNHIAAYAIAKSMQQDRLDAAEARRVHHARSRPDQPQRQTHFGELARVLLLGFRQRPEPTR